MAKYTVRLPRLPVNWKEQPQLFERYWDEAMTQLETTLNAILEIPELQTAIQQAKAAADNANAAAATAQDAADSAQGAADATAADTSLVNSYVANFTAPVLSATSLGVVTIANHERVYGDSTLNPTVPVTGGSLPTSAATGDAVRIFYDDASRSGGAVTYQFSIDPAPPPVQSGNRHSVGVVTIPAAGSQGGKPVRPPGYVEP